MGIWVHECMTLTSLTEMGVEVRGGEFMLNTPNLSKGKPGVRENYFVLWFSSPFGIESSVFSHSIFPWKRCDYCLLKTFSDYGVINACESKPVKWKRRIWPLRRLHFDYYGLWYLSICVHCSRFVSFAKTKHADQEQLRGVGRGAYSVFNSRSLCILERKPDRNLNSGSHHTHS